MKTRIMKMIGLMTLLISMFGFTSCELELRPWYEDECHGNYEDTRMLCSRTWEESWFENGTRYTQRLDFYDNRTGKDYLKIERRDGYVTEDVYYFDWSWDGKNSIRMEYGYDDISYFERIWIKDNTLTGYLDN